MSFLGVGYPGVGYLAWVGYPGAGYTLSPLGDEATTAVGTTHPTGMLSCFTIRTVEWINVRWTKSHVNWRDLNSPHAEVIYADTRWTNNCGNGRDFYLESIRLEYLLWSGWMPLELLEGLWFELLPSQWIWVDAMWTKHSGDDMYFNFESIGFESPLLQWSGWIPEGPKITLQWLIIIII